MRLFNLIWLIVGIGLLIYAGVTYSAVTRQMQDVVADIAQTQAIGIKGDESETENAPSVALPRLFSNRGRELTDKQIMAMLSGEPAKGGARLTLREEFDLLELMGEGEDIPEGDLRNLMANVRSIALARARCADIVRVFDGGCVYDDHKARPEHGSPTTYELDADCIVAFSNGLGKIPQGDAFSIIDESVQARFAYNPGRPDDILKPDYETALRRALSYLAEACDTIRTSTDNCYVKSAVIGPARKRGDDTMPRLEVKGTLQFLMPVELAELR